MRTLAPGERLDVFTDTALSGGLHEDAAVRSGGTYTWKHKIKISQCLGQAETV
jgi:hypothetical protein